MRLINHYSANPSLQFRYAVYSAKLPGTILYARSAQQPAFDNKPIKVDYQNGSFYVKGKTDWNPITLRCYQFEGITLLDFWKYVQQHQIVKDAIDQYQVLYKHDMRVVVLNPMDIPISTWKLVGAFFSDVNFGDMDWGTDDVTEIEVTIRYDYAEYSFLVDGVF